jgi:uncharacterized protein YrrD
MTIALLRGRDVSGMPVVDISTGEDVAEVRDLIFEPGQGDVGGFTLANRGFLGRRLGQILPVKSIRSVGTHAVTIESTNALSDVESARRSGHGGDVTNDVVVTESGRELGRVKDVILRGGPQPRVVGYEIGGGAAGDGFVPIDTSRAVSGSTLIVPDRFENLVRTDLTGLAGEIENLERGESS